MSKNDKFIQDALAQNEETFEDAVKRESFIPKTVQIKDITKVPKGSDMSTGELFKERTVWKVFNCAIKKLTMMNGLGVDSLIGSNKILRERLYNGEISEAQFENHNAETQYRIKFEYYEA